MTVKEISKLTGISVRMLHYYDKIGLLPPSKKSEAGYRLYDDKALETLRQILFFREFDIPLKEIKAIMENPAFDRNQILQMQKKMLVSKRERLNRLIASIDDILKGVDKMEFSVFNKNEIEEMWNAMASHMSAEQKAIFLECYGSMEEWKKQFLKNASSEQAQRNYARIVEWYGSKEKAMEAARNPGNSQLFPAYQKRLEAIMNKLAEKKGQGIKADAFEVKELIGEYDFVAKQMYQMEDVSKFMLELASAYQTNETMQKYQDSIYEEGVTLFIGQAIENFYH